MTPKDIVMAETGTPEEMSQAREGTYVVYFRNEIIAVTRGPVDAWNALQAHRQARAASISK